MSKKSERIKTADKKGNIYDKFRLFSDGNVVICVDGKNKHYKGQPNVSIRTGESKFGSEVVFQLQINEEVSEYDADSGFEKHVEFYFTKEQALEILPQLLSAIGGSTEGFNGKHWDKDLCELCGEHNVCPKCQTHTWSKKNG